MERGVALIDEAPQPFEVARIPVCVAGDPPSLMVLSLKLGLPGLGRRRGWARLACHGPEPGAGFVCRTTECAEERSRSSTHLILRP
jgi:hypothetical protein